MSGASDDREGRMSGGERGGAKMLGTLQARGLK